MIWRTLRTLLAGSGFLVVAGCLGMWAAGDSEPTVQDQPRRLAPQNLVLPTPVDLAAYVTTLARPLFNTDRRPVPGATAATGPVAAEGSEAPSPVSRLVAVAIGPERRAAIVQLTAGGSQVLMQGEHIDDWVLTQIAPDHVVLRLGTRQAAFALPAHLPGQK